MKILFLPLILVLFVGCASSRGPSVMVRPRDVPGNGLPTESLEAVRQSEQVKAYPLARYVDPNNRRIMHEAHTVYRVETTPKWELKSPSFGAVSAPLQRRVAADTTPQRDELIAELHRQKDATRSVLQGTQAISQQLTQLGASVQQTKAVAAENVVLRRQVEATQRRLEALETELRSQPQPRPAPAKVTPNSDDW